MIWKNEELINYIRKRLTFHCNNAMDNPLSIALKILDDIPEARYVPILRESRVGSAIMVYDHLNREMVFGFPLGHPNTVIEDSWHKERVKCLDEFNQIVEEFLGPRMYDRIMYVEMHSGPCDFTVYYEPADF